MDTTASGTAPDGSPGSPAFGGAALVIFSLPFVLAGLWALAHVDGVVDALMSGLFASIGIGMLIAGVLTRRRDRAIRELQARHPSSPWMWKPEWASGRIGCDSRVRLGVVGGFALFWNVFVWTALLQEPNPIGLIFVVVGLVLLGWAIRELLRWRQQGRSVLEMASLPGVLGGVLEGAVQLRGRSTPLRGFELTLGCYEEGSQSERLVWEHASHVAAGHCGRGPAGPRVPVRLEIPYGARPTRWGGSAITWRLRVESADPRARYRASFEVPVFHTAHSSPDLDEVAADPPAAVDRAALSTPAGTVFEPGSRIRVSLGSDGRQTLAFAAARHPGQALLATGACLFCWFMAWMWTHSGGLSARLLPLVVGAGAVLLTGATLTLWLRSRRVVVDARGVEIRTRFLGVGPTRRVAAHEVERVEVRLRMNSGERSWYDLRIHRHGGRPLVAGTLIPSKREAVWLASCIERGLRGEIGLTAG